MADLERGTIFAGHRIEGVAGKGGMGVVYRATHLVLDHVVALKVISPELAADEVFRERFRSESRIAVSLRHPNVVPIHHAGEEDGRLFVTMDLIEGTDLRGLLNERGRLEPDEAARIVAQVASALDVAHSRGLVHRDIKPGNILIERRDGRQHVYLTDFGLSKQIGSSSGVTASGAFVGTLDYVAPEQIKGQGVDARADVYALGCVLFELLAGTAPFSTREEKVAKIYAHLQDEPPSLLAMCPDLPFAFEAVVHRALAKDPDLRYPSAGDLGRAATAAVEGELASEAERSVAIGAAAPTQDFGALGAGAPAAQPGPGATQPAVSPPAEMGPATPHAAATGPATPPPAAATEPVAAPPAPTPGAAGGPSQPLAPEDPTLQSEPAPVLPGRTPPRGPAPAAARRRRLMLGGLAGAAVIAVIAVVALGGGGSNPSASKNGGGAGGGSGAGGGAKEESTGKAVGAGNTPVGVAVIDSRLLVGDRGSGQLQVLDAASGKPTHTALPVGADPQGVDAGDVRIWVTNSGDDTVSRFDQSTLADLGPLQVGDQPLDVATGNHAVWVASAGGTITRITPNGDAAPIPIDVGGEPQGIDAMLGSDAVWFSDRQSGSLRQLDPGANKATTSVSVGKDPKGVLVATSGSVWVANTGSGTVSRVDANGKGETDFPVGDGPRELAEGFGSIWVTCGDSDDVYRLDAKSGEVQSITPVDGSPEGIAVAEGAGTVWVALGDKDQIVPIQAN